MNTEKMLQEIGEFLEKMGIRTKEIKYIFDKDLHTDIVSLRMSHTLAKELLENNEEVLRAVNWFIRTWFQKKHHHFRDIVLDINNKHIDFINYTKEKAFLALERVDYFNKPYEFGYLNSYERMLIHSVLKKHQHITTASHGEGRDRRLVIQKKHKQ